MDKIVQDMTAKMQKSLDALKGELAAIRTGRANSAMLDGVIVECYGSTSPLNQVGTIGVPDARLITIQPWDASLIPAIEKAIQKAQLGLSPVNDGKLIRLPIPPLTEERRKEFGKLVKRYAEEARVAVRNIRRDANEHVKSREKEEGVSEDEIKRVMHEIQRHTDEYIKKIDQLASTKEQEIMKV